MNYGLGVPGIDGSIELQLAGFDPLICTDFLSGSYPREIVGGASLQYSTAGSSVSSGPRYEPKHIWDLSVAFVTAEDVLLLEQIYRAFELTIPHPSVVVVDRNRPLIEFSPRSRALAPGGGELVLSGGQIAYPAVFLVHFVGAPAIDDKGASWGCSFVLQEVEKSAP